MDYSPFVISGGVGGVGGVGEGEDATGDGSGSGSLSNLCRFSLRFVYFVFLRRLLSGTPEGVFI